MSSCEKEDQISGKCNVLIAIGIWLHILSFRPGFRSPKLPDPAIFLWTSYPTRQRLSILNKKFIFLSHDFLAYPFRRRILTAEAWYSRTDQPPANRTTDAGRDRNRRLSAAASGARNPPALAKILGKLSDFECSMSSDIAISWYVQAANNIIILSKNCSMMIFILLASVPAHVCKWPVRILQNRLYLQLKFWMTRFSNDDQETAIQERLKLVSKPKNCFRNRSILFQWESVQLRQLFARVLISRCQPPIRVSLATAKKSPVFGPIYWYPQCFRGMMMAPSASDRKLYMYR